MAFYTYYDCSNIIEVTFFILVLGSVALSFLNMFKPDLKEKKVAAHNFSCRYCKTSRMR